MWAQVAAARAGGAVSDSADHARFRGAAEELEAIEDLGRLTPLPESPTPAPTGRLRVRTATNAPSRYRPLTTAEPAPPTPSPPATKAQHAPSEASTSRHDPPLSSHSRSGPAGGGRGRRSRPPTHESRRPHGRRLSWCYTPAARQGMKLSMSTGA